MFVPDLGHPSKCQLRLHQNIVNTCTVVVLLDLKTLVFRSTLLNMSLGILSGYYTEKQRSGCIRKSHAVFGNAATMKPTATQLVYSREILELEMEEVRLKDTLLHERAVRVEPPATTESSGFDR